MHQIRAHRLIAAAGVSLCAAALLSACADNGAEETVVATEAETKPSDTAAPPPDDAFSYLTPEQRPTTGLVAEGNYWGINELVAKAEHAVVATVVEVDEPVWTGKAYSVRPDGSVSPLNPQYRRDVSLSVDRVLFSDTLTAGVDLSVVVDGTGQAGGYPIGFPNLNLTVDEVVPPLSAGDTVLLLLTEYDVPTEKGDVEALQPTAGSYLSVWLVGSDGIARNLDATRDLPLDLLIERIEVEREAGLGQPTSNDSLQEPYAPETDDYAPDPLSSTSVP